MSAAVAFSPLPFLPQNSFPVFCLKLSFYILGIAAEARMVPYYAFDTSEGVAPVLEPEKSPAGPKQPTHKENKLLGPKKRNTFGANPTNQPPNSFKNLQPATALLGQQENHSANQELNVGNLGFPA